jgi:hypothetical protein
MLAGTDSQPARYARIVFVLLSMLPEVYVQLHLWAYQTSLPIRLCCWGAAATVRNPYSSESRLLVAPIKSKRVHVSRKCMYNSICGLIKQAFLYVYNPFRLT